MSRASSRTSGGYHKPMPARDAAAEARSARDDLYARTGVLVDAWPGQSPDEHLATIRAVEQAGVLSPGRRARAYGIEL